MPSENSFSTHDSLILIHMENQVANIPPAYKQGDLLICGFH